MAGFFFISENITKPPEFNILSLMRFADRIPPNGISLLLLDMFKRLNLTIPKWPSLKL